MKQLISLVTIIMALLLPQFLNARTGVDYTPRASAFSVETNQDAQQVKLRIYKEGKSGKPVKTVNMKREKPGGTLWQATVKGDLKGQFYTFDVKYGGKFKGECPGIWATAVGVNGKRGAIVDMTQTNPQGWAADKRPAIAAKDLILYEMHHRDFSIDESGGFIHKGKFLALTEPRAISHLKELGVNAVHILPSFDYASVDETRLNEPQYNWMVQALHKAGIKVILDVVYNHTWNIDESNFQLTRPDYFYRKNADGTYSNGSGCGNETASERDGMRQFMIESVKYWVDEYHIDGFRFDLMGVHDIETMNAIRKAVPDDIFIYGEGWSAGSCAYSGELAMKANISKMPGIAAFSDCMRDGLRGPWDSNSKAAFLGGVKGYEESIKFGIVGAIQHPGVNYQLVNYSKAPYAHEPTQMIAYVSCHDDMCLVDRLKASVKGITQDELIRLDLLAQTVVMTSQGVPFMLSGEEMLRDKKGVHNSYESPDSINHLDWDNLERYPQVMDYYKNLIALRKAHPAFHMGSADMVRKNLDFLPGGNCLVAYHINGRGVPGEQWGDIYVAFNAHKRARTIEVPDGTYTVVCRNIKCDQQGIGVVKGSKITIPAQSALIIHN